MKIIVPVLNRYDLLQRMVMSLTEPVDLLLIIDNGDALEDLTVPDTVAETRILHMPNNMGVAGSWNLGIKMLPFESVWYFSSADAVFTPESLREFRNASPDEITLANNFPYWQSFAIGEKVVEKIGLFDESIYPIYFEDTEYVWRAEASMVKIVHIGSPVNHDNSSTINSDANLSRQNNTTFSSNSHYYEQKKAQGDFSEGRWDLNRRRRNNWQR